MNRPAPAPIARILFAAACVAPLLGAVHPARAADAATEWTLLADRLGRGAANRRTPAAIHRAMHDAPNAALPV